MIQARAQRVLHRTGQVALSVTALLGALALLLTVLALVSGARPLIFRSGSMSPGIPTGSLGFARAVDAPDIRVGDIVTVPTVGGDRVTHRVVDVTHHDDVATLRLKGDANNAPDDALYRVTQARRLWFSVPRAGYVVSWLSNAPGSYLLAGYVGLMLMLVARRRRDPGPRGPEAADPVAPIEASADPPAESGVTASGPARVVTAGALLVLGAAIVSGWGQSTWALWTDLATVGTSAISTGAAPAAPTGITCTAGSAAANTITISWTAVSGATGYTVTRTGASATTVATTSLTFTGSNNQSGQASVQSRVGTNWLSASSVAIKYTFGNGNNKAPTCDGFA